MEQDRKSTDGQVREMARVATVDVRRPTVTSRTGGVLATAVHPELDQAVRAVGLTNLERAQVRQQGGNAHGQTSGARAS